MNVGAIKKRLCGTARECRIEWFSEIDSTNTYTKGQGTGGAPDGLVVIAERQSAGRGRLQRSFFSPDGTGLYMSVLLRRDLKADDALYLTTAAAVSVAQAMEAVLGRSVDIKWVNDIYIDGKKACGILTEGAIKPGENALDFAVVGIGVNVAPPVGGFPPEIKEIAGAMFDGPPPQNAREVLTAEILNRLMIYIQDDQRAAVLAEYRSRSVVIGKRISVHSASGVKAAVALGVDDRFRLHVRYDDGSQAYLDSGEISIRLSE